MNIMTTLVVDEDIVLSKTSFKNIKDLYEALYEEILEQKMQEAKKTENFINF